MKLAFGLLVLVIGCASKPQPDTQPAPQAAAPEAAAASTAPDTGATPALLSMAFAGTTERIWAALPKAYKSVGITVNAVDTATHSIGFSGRIHGSLGGVRLSKYFKCGSSIGDNADSYDLTLFIGSQVGRDPKTDGIIVTTRLRVSARSAFGGFTVCSTNGELEGKLWKAIGAELNR